LILFLFDSFEHIAQLQVEEARFRYPAE